MPQITNVVKLKLNPDKLTAAYLDDQSRKCNSLYNKLVEKANHHQKELINTGNPESAKILYSPHGLRNLVPGLKNEYHYLKSVYAAPLKNTALRLTDCIKTHRDSRKGKRAGKKTGWPKFRSWSKKFFSLLYDEPNKGFYVKNNILHLSLGLGMDRKRKSLQIPILEAQVLRNKEIRNLRIVKEDNIFYAVFTVVRSIPDLKLIKKMLALDPNHKNLVYGVDNLGNAIEIMSPYWLKVIDLRIDELKSKRDRCKRKSQLKRIVDKDGNVIREWYEPSRRYKKLDAAIKRLLAKRREQTKSFCYRIANLLCAQYDLIAIGDYAPHGDGLTTQMRRAMNNRSLIGRFKEVLAWVAKRSGKLYVEFAEKGTTRTCHACNYVHENGINPGIRQWICPQCTTSHIRDENAAINGYNKVLWNLQKESKDLLSLPVPSSGRVVMESGKALLEKSMIKERWAWKVLSSGSLVCRGDKTAGLSFQPKIDKDESALARN